MNPLDLDALKAHAASRALEFVEDGMTIGLGTGSTARHLIRLMADRIRDGLHVRCVPTSIETQNLARSLGIPLTTLAAKPDLDLAIDGADEVDPQRNLIKGAGGALVREKVVAQAARRRIIMVDPSKLVPVLGSKSPVPVEVIPFAAHTAAAELARLGAQVNPRLRGSRTVITDNGNRILDARFGEIPDPARLEREITAIPGVVDCGLFVGMNPTIVVGTEEGTQILS